MDTYDINKVYWSIEVKFVFFPLNLPNGRL